MLTKLATVIAFVGTTHPDEALHFYRDILGLQLMADEEFALVFDANRTMLRVAKVDRFEPLPFTVLGWNVANIQAEMHKLVEKGVIFERFAGMAQDENGVVTFPDGTQVAWFRDPAGNLLSLSQFSPGGN